MRHIQSCLAAQALSADLVTLSGTYARRLAYSKGNAETGGTDFYAVDFTRIVIVAPGFKQELTSGPVFDNASDLIMTSEASPRLFEESPIGVVVDYPEVTLVTECGKAIRRWDAHEHLSNVVMEGSDEAVQDARWEVFSLTDAFDQNPCSRETFDEVTRLQEEAGTDLRFRDFYANWLADQQGAAAPGI
jgi:hypothetical protein